MAGTGCVFRKTHLNSFSSGNELMYEINFDSGLYLLVVCSYPSKFSLISPNIRNHVLNPHARTHMENNRTHMWTCKFSHNAHYFLRCVEIEKEMAFAIVHELRPVVVGLLKAKQDHWSVRHLHKELLKEMCWKMAI